MVSLAGAGIDRTPGGREPLRVRLPASTGINNTKPQLFVDTVFIPKRKPKANNKPKSKRSKPSPRRQPKPPSAKHRPSKPRKPALTHQERKEQGLCRCNQPAIQGQTRCATCAEKHRIWCRQYSENRRRAKGIKPRRRISPELIEQIQQDIADKEASQVPKKVRNEAYKKKQREAQASLRAERKALGLCRDCGKPKPEGQTRCADCIQKHRQYWQRYVAKSTRQKATE